MKKIIVFVLMFLSFTSGAIAYNPTTKDTQVLNSLYSKLDLIGNKSSVKLQKLGGQIDILKEKYKNNEKIYFILSQAVNYINNKYITTVDTKKETAISEVASTELLGNIFSTTGRNWQIHEVKIFNSKDLFIPEGKKLLGLDISYTNTFTSAYNFPGNYSVFSKFKDSNGFEFIWEDRDYIGTSMKGGIINSGETRRGWMFIELNNEIEKGSLNFTFNDNGVEKNLYKNIIIPKAEKEVEELKEHNLDIGLNEKFQLDGIEYEITSIKTIYDLGLGSYPKKPDNAKFILIDYSYKNINNKNGYPGNFKLKLGEYLYDESSVVTSFGYNIYKYYGGGSNKVLEGTKRDTYTGFDIKDEDLSGSTLIIEGWANDEYKVFIPLKNLLNSK